MKTYPTIQSLREALVDLMETHRINQLEVSRRTGLAQSAISHFINGQRGLSGDSALAIAHYIRAVSLWGKSTHTDPITKPTPPAEASNRQTHTGM